MLSPPFDYTNRDFESLRADLTARLARAMPEWTGYDAAFETILIELFSMVGDILNFYIDRMGNEAFLQTAVLRESVLNLAELFGYIPSARAAASCTVQFTKVDANAEVTVPQGTQIYAEVETEEPVIFETSAAITILSGTPSGTVTAVEGQTVTEENVATSDGTEGQQHPLFYANVIRDSVRVYTDDGPIDPSTNAPTLQEWQRFDRLIDANATDRAFSLYVNEDGITLIRFGDGVTGQIPPTNASIYSTYRHGRGTQGNLGIGYVRSLVDSDLAEQIETVVNTTAAQGGADEETIEGMRFSIPRSLRTLDRAVTLDDYAALAMQVPGVAKAVALAETAGSVIVHIAPVGGYDLSVEPGPGNWDVGNEDYSPNGQATELLSGQTLNYLNDRKLIGTDVTVLGADYVAVDMTVSLQVNERYRQDIVRTAVEQVIVDVLHFDRVDFGQRMTKAVFFKEIVGLPGVDYVEIDVFELEGTPGSGDEDFDLTSENMLPFPGTITVNATGGVVIY